MARFERSRERRSNTRTNDSFEDYQKKGTRNKRSFSGGNRDRRSSGRDSGSYGRNRGELTMTKVTCSSCNVECEVPFKPTSSKPVYCKDCFSKQNKSSSYGQSRSSRDGSNKDFDIINKKLDKIMRALDIN
jgi:CxxC-x17-CxxC domain-containing protein